MATNIENVNAILKELEQVLNSIPEDQAAALVKAVRSANRVFVAGAGRSLLMISGFAMRLMQTGYQSFVVGDTTTPSIQEGDLLVIASGSGETGTLKVIASGAKKAGAKLALITSEPTSSIALLSDLLVVIPASTPKSDNVEGKILSIQPGASAFEQSVLLLCDALTIALGKSEEDLSAQNSSLMKLHANLE